jgi:hypothetical protein
MRAVVLTALLLSGCNAVFGLEERALVEDAEVDSEIVAGDADAEPDTSIINDEGVDSDVDTTTPDSSLPSDTTTPADTSTPPDTTAPADTFTPTPDTTPPPDTAPMDTGTPCPIFGLKCAAGQTCIVSRSSTGTYSYACETPPTGATTGASCVLDVGKYKCAEGLACNDRFPSGTICVPLCASATACSSITGYPFCSSATWTTSPMPSVDVCDYCDPVSTTACMGTTEGRCGISSLSTPPSCRKDFGGRDPGQSCNPGNCREGTVCDCGTELGIDGCSGKPGVCVKLCNTNAECLLISGTTCVPLRTGYPIKGCK